MEENKKAAKAFVDTYFPVKQQQNQSKFPDVLGDLFPPAHHYQESSWKQGYDGQSSGSAAAAADGYSHGKGKSSQGGGGAPPPPQRRSGSAVVFCEVADPCSMSSSVDYGCRDNYYPAPSGNHNEKEKKEAYEYPDPEHSRGEWWKGSLYY